jgi:hypothetical protein
MYLWRGFVAAAVVIACCARASVSAPTAKGGAGKAPATRTAAAGTQAAPGGARPGEEVVTDPAQLDPKDRLRRIRIALQVMERSPRDDTTKPWVGFLLFFRRDLADDDTDRAAAVLEEVTGQKFGKDFEAWARWYEGVRGRDPWKPFPIYKPKAGVKPAEPPQVLVFSPRITKEADGTHVLEGPSDMHCPEAGLHIWSDGPLRVKVLDRDGHVRLDGRLSTLSGQITVNTTGANLFLNGREPVFLDVAALRRIVQHADDQLLGQEDPQKVSEYVHFEARRGNLLPLVRHAMRGRSGAKWATPEARKEVAAELGMDAAAIAKLTDEELGVEVLRRFEFTNLIRTVEVRVERTAPNRCDKQVRSVNGTAFDKIVRTKDGWVPG